MLASANSVGTLCEGDNDTLGLSITVTTAPSNDILPMPPRGQKPVVGKWYRHKKHGISKCLGYGNWACIHNKQRSLCKHCDGKGLCSHGRSKSLCVPCGGAHVCQHKRLRTQCATCGGTSMCSHGRQKAVCVDCKGNAICGHGSRKNNCKKCCGVSTCVHGKLRSLCKACLTIKEHQHSRLFCALCFDKRLSPARLPWKGGSGICATCEPDAKKRLEHRVRDALLPMIQQSPEAIETVRFGTDCQYQDTSYRMPDLLWTVYDATGKLTGIVKVGVDEDSHCDRTAECEGGKVSNQCDSINELAFRMDKELAKGTKAKLSLGLLAKHLETRRDARVSAEMGGRRLLPQFFIKANFDAYDGPRTTWDTRLKTIADRVNALLAHLREGAPGTDTTRPHVEFYWYHSKAKFITDHFFANSAAVHTTVC